MIRRSTQDFQYIKHKINKQNVKCASLKNRLVFLLKCRTHKIIPTFISNSLKSIMYIFRSNKLITPITNKLKYILLNLSIQETISNIRTAESTQRENINALRNSQASNRDIRYLINNLKSDQMDKRKQKQGKLYNKFINLHNEAIKHSSINFENKSDWVVNLSNYEIPHYVNKAISLGPNFIFHESSFNKIAENIIIDTEHIINDTINDSECKNNIRNKINLLLTKQMYKSKTTILSPADNASLNLLKLSKHFLNTLKNELVIVKSDKNGKSVIMDKTDYDNKMLLLLSDNNNYMAYKTDPTTRLTNKINSYIDNLYHFNQIDKNTKDKLIFNETSCPRIYGLPKLHKSNIPLRPIVSGINGPLEKIAKFMAPSLKALSISDYDITNSFEVKSVFDGMTIQDTDTIVSFDVVSLYTNVPINKTIGYINDHWNEIAQYTTLNNHHYFTTLRYILNNNFIKFNNNFFKQIRGVAMGNNLSAPIANITMNMVLNDRISTWNKKFPKTPIKCLRKYVDDLIIIINSNAINDLLVHFNNYHKYLAFTCEDSNRESISFLDTKLHITNNKIWVDWYQKPTHIGRLINYFSNHPMYMKLNVASNLINRGLKLGASKNKKVNLDIITKILKNNDYPDLTIKYLINKAKASHYSTKIPQKMDNKNILNYRTFSITYYNYISEKIKQLLLWHIKQNNVDINITISFSIKNRNQLYSRLKTPINLLEQHNIIYCLKCNDCECVYIGQSKQKCKMRMYQHGYSIKHKKRDTALSVHAIDNGHSFNIDEPKILSHEKILSRRLTYEALAILKNINHTVNYKTDSDNLNTCYKHLLNQLYDA